MSRYLLTGARAPAALELARNLNKHGHIVIAADSIRYPIARHSKSISKFFRISEPRGNFNQFKRDLIKIIKDEDIDILLPTCEEIFYISKIKDNLTDYCTVVCPEFELIKQLHSKYSVLNLVKQFGVSVPTSKLLSMENLLLEHGFRNKVIKAEYSRFGSDVLIEPNIKDLRKLLGKDIESYVLQEKINGIEVCNYAIAIKGELILHTAYQPKYRIGKSAGIYFNQVINESITNFTKALLADLHFTGQIGFDFIIENDRLYLIECNPRANSGVHLLHNIDIDNCLSNKSKYIDVKTPSSAMIALAMPLYALPNALFEMKIGKFIKDFRAGRDVISSKNDRIFIFYQFVSLFELITSAIRYRLSLRKASTRDIEWNGRELL